MSAGAEPTWRGVALVAVGGSVGTMCRHLLDLSIVDLAGLPGGTFAINVSGAFLLGALIEFLALSGPDHGRRRDLRLLLGTGLLGGYTTYSALATDTAAMLVSDHAVMEAIGYALATVIVGGLACWAGVLAARAPRGRR